MEKKRERKRDPHRCLGCSAQFEVTYFDDRGEERGPLPVLAEVACPRCGRKKSVSVATGAEQTLEVELDEIGEADEGSGG